MSDERDPERGEAPSNEAGAGAESRGRSSRRRRRARRGYEGRPEWNDRGEGNAPEVRTESGAPGRSEGEAPRRELERRSEDPERGERPGRREEGAGRREPGGERETAGPAGDEDRGEPGREPGRRGRRRRVRGGRDRREGAGGEPARDEGAGRSAEASGAVESRSEAPPSEGADGEGRERRRRRPRRRGRGGRSESGEGAEVGPGPESASGASEGVAEAGAAESARPAVSEGQGARAEAGPAGGRSGSGRSEGGRGRRSEGGTGGRSESGERRRGSRGEGRGESRGEARNESRGETRSESRGEGRGSRGGPRRGDGRDRGRERSGDARGAGARNGSRDFRGGGSRTGGGYRGGTGRPSGSEQPLKPTAELTLPPQPVRVMIAGGGTGGHVIPALGIWEALLKRNPESQVMFLGSDRGIEREMLGNGYRLEEFSLKGLPRRPDVSSFRAAVAMVKAYRRIRKLMDEFKPGVLVGTGGYVMVPAVVAARRAGVPIVLQEQNSVPGRANRFLSRWASEVHVHFAESRRYFKDRGKLRLSGNPVRVKIAEGRALRTLQKMRLFPDRKTVVILGGSQGAHSLNVAFTEMLPHFRGDRAVQFVIQTGKEDHPAVVEAVRQSGARVVARPFFNHMEDLYAIAHLVVGRAGAMTVSEISACGLPSILIPYPHAMNDHQAHNAHALEEKEAAVVLDDKDLSGERLAAEIRKLFADPARMRTMARNAFRLSRPDAARRIAEAVEKLGGGAPQSMLHVPEEYDAAEPDEED